MAGKRQTEVVVDDGFDDIEFDEADNVDPVQDITPVKEVPQVEDLGATEVPVPNPPTPPSELATTESFFGGAPASSDIEDLGVVTVSPDAPTYDVAVTEDIGPVFYGMKVIEMKKGRLYKVTDDVYEYLYSRRKLVGQ